MSSFKDLRIVDNFYQTSSFFPMPTVCISTVNPDGTLNIGSYSLCFPYYIAGKERYAMVLECRNTSNTCQNIMRTHKCAINFITDEKKYFKEAVRLGFPGPSEEKMKEPLLFTMEDGLADPADKERPQMPTRSLNAPGRAIWKERTSSGSRISMTDIRAHTTISTASLPDTELISFCISIRS